MQAHRRTDDPFRPQTTDYTYTTAWWVEYDFQVIFSFKLKGAGRSLIAVTEWNLIRRAATQSGADNDGWNIAVKRSGRSTQTRCVLSAEVAAYAHAHSGVVR